MRHSVLLTDRLAAVCFLGLLVAPHLLLPPIEAWRQVDAAAERPNWAAPVPVRWPAPREPAELLHGRYTQRLDATIRDTTFARWIRAIGNELAYRFLAAVPARILVGTDGRWFLGGSIGPLQDGGWRTPGFRRQLQGCLTPLARLGELLAARGIVCVVAPIPLKLSLYPDSVPRGRAQRAARGFTDPAYAMLLAELRRRGLVAVDVRAALLALRTAQEHEPFFARDTHLNSAGVAALGRAIAAQLRASVPSLRDQVAAPGSRVEQTVELHRADTYVAMGFRKPPILMDDFLYEETIVHYPDAVTDDPARARVAVAGTSFGALYGPQFGGHANLAHLIAHALDLVVVDHCIYAGGPTQGLMQLVRALPDLPQLEAVVVEFPFRYLGDRDWDQLDHLLVTGETVPGIEGTPGPRQD